MGLLDFLNNPPAGLNGSPISYLSNPALWGNIQYPSPLSAPGLQVAPGQAPNPQDAASYGMLGMDPSAIPMPVPAVSPFPQQDKPAAPTPPATGFGAGALPFGFAGPGSNVVSPSQIAAPSPIPVPQPRPAAADAPPAAVPVATDVSSVNRGAGFAAAPVPSDAVNPAPAAAPAAAPSPAPFSLGGAGDRLNLATKGFAGNLALGPVGALLGGLGALVTGQPTDAGSIAAQQGTATARALLAKGASAADVQAAVHNPALMKALIDSYYGKDKFKVVQTGENDNGKQFQIFNETDGSLKPISVSSDAGELGGTVMGPNGKPIVIPPGVNRKEFIKQVTHTVADAATGKATEAQAKASSFAARMQQAEAIMPQLQSQGLSLSGKALGEVPGGVGNYAQSKEYQQYKQAQSAFITALLRQESGAAINKSEFDRYEKEMFPQPGDDASVVQQKAGMRAAAIQQMQRAAGPGYVPPAVGAGNHAPGTVKGTTANGVSWSVQ